MHTLSFIDLFANVGGLSDGFIWASYTPLVHIEMDDNTPASCQHIYEKQEEYTNFRVKRMRGLQGML